MNKLALVLLFLAGQFWNGLAILYLYRWFFMPAFDTRDITFFQAVGLSLFIEALIGFLPSKHDAKSTASEHMESLFVYPIIALILGYIIHLFV